MPPVTHQRDTRVSLIWGNVEKPVTAGSPTTPDFDKVGTLTALTSLALPVESFAPFSINPKTRRLSRHTGKRHRSVGDTWNDMKGAIPGVTLSMPANKDILDLFLYSGFQRVEEGALSPFVKTFQYPDITAANHAAGRYPDFEANEGGFFGLVFSSRASALGTFEEIMMGCVPTQLRFSCASADHDGCAWLEVDLIARFLDTNTSYTGTITDYVDSPSVRFHINDLGTRTVMGVASTPIYGFGFTIDTGLEFVPFGGTGGGGSVNCTMNGPNSTFWVDYMVDDTGTGVHSVSRDDSAGAFQTPFGSASGGEIGWGDGTASTDGEMDITWNGQVVSYEPVGDQEMRYKITWDCAEYSNNDALQVLLANALDRGW